MVIAVLIGVGSYFAVTQWQHRADVAALRIMTEEQLAVRLWRDMLAVKHDDARWDNRAKLPSYQEALRRGSLDRNDMIRAGSPDISMEQPSEAPKVATPPPGPVTTSSPSTVMTGTDEDAENQLLEKEARRQQIAERVARQKANDDRTRDDATIRDLHKESDDRVRALRERQATQDAGENVP